MLNVYLSLSPLDPLSPPGRGIERTREVLCLASNLAIAELHDANRVDMPAADPLTRLGIFYHDVIVLDLVFGVQVTPCGGL
jgi:hypothetical protein